MMGVLRSQYGRMLDKPMKKGESMEQANRQAIEKSKVKPMKEKEGWVGELKRKSHELLKGEKAYIS